MMVAFLVVAGARFGARAYAPARRAAHGGAPWATVLELELDVGRCVGVRLPPWGLEPAAAPVPGCALAAELDPAELAYPLDGSFSGAAAADFYGGRLALRRALGGAAAAPILKSAGGAPDLPRGVLGSISHKRPLAVAVARPRTGGDVAAALGVDVERAAEPSVGGERLARRVLAAGDRAAYDALSGAVDDGARAALFFSLKEAVYKAVAADAPRARFRDVALAPGADGSCAVAAADGLLPAGASVDAAWRLVEHDGAPYFLSTASYRRGR